MRFVFILAAIAVLGWAPAPVVAVLSWVLIGYLVWAAWPTICRHWHALGQRRPSPLLRRPQREGRYSADRRGVL